MRIRQSLPKLRQVAWRSALDSNKPLYRDAILLWCSLYLDLIEGCGGEVSEQIVARLCSLMRGESIFSLIAKLEDFDAKLLHTRSRTDFYLLVEKGPGGIPHYGDISRYARWCVDAPSVTCHGDDWFVTTYRSFLLFLKRIQGPSVATDHRVWIETDQSISNVRVPNLDISLPTVPLSSRPSHLTTGSVADVKGSRGRPGLKSKASCTLSRAAWKAVTKHDLIFPNSQMDPSRRIIGDPICVLHNVPKNWKTDRFITMEPAAQAWMQRRIGDSLRASLPLWTQGFCNPEDDSMNRYLIGLPGFSTIDLTSASDTVHRDWIRTIPDPTLRRLMYATRCPVVRTSYGDIYQQKAAGMGCGWTFGLECWVFSSIVLSCRPSTSWAVFGDDIVVEDSLFSDVCQKLSQYGFQVNQEKSFGPDYPFKESCGRHVFHWGTTVDATPILFPGRTTTRSIADASENFVFLQREACRRNWLNVRYVCSSELRLPFSNDWDSQLPFCLGDGVQPDPAWGTYPLPGKPSKRYSVSDVCRYPWSLLQDNVPDPAFPNLDEQWDVRFDWLRRLSTVQPEGWQRGIGPPHNG